MDTLRFTILKFSTFLLLAYLISSISAASKYNTEENKPYEFGFNIEGEQHRREKKDENGIIMGEFGFITADGVYHVTVYATDENGNFKILSMKNIRLGAAPDKVPPNATPVNKILEPVTLPPPPPPPRPPPVSNQQQPFTTPKPLPIASCSHCSIPSKPPPVAPNPFAPPPNQFNTPSTSLQGPLSNTNYNDLPQGDQPFNPQNTPNYNQPGSGQNFQNPGFPQSPAGQFSPNQQFGNQPNNKYTTPVVIAANMQKVPAEVANQPLLQGENPGLPNGVTSDNMMDLLYRFNYTIGFHGHYEQGYTNGAKVGEYYINYRNGYATKVSYVANENGYRPTITTVRLSPNETPNPETEKDEDFGLRGYEFKWFYVPKYHHLNRY